MNPEHHYIVAVDVSKDSLQINTPVKCVSIPNSSKDIDSLIADIRQHPNPLVVFEATGGYEALLKSKLHEHAVALCLVSAYRVRAFAKSEGMAAKTDPIDAEVIRRFALEKQLRLTPAPSKEQLQLIAHMDRRSQLVDHLAIEKTRLKLAPQLARQSIQAMIRFIESQIASIESAVSRLVNAQNALKEASVKMQSVSGVGEVTAWSILAYLGEIRSIPRNTLIALAGLAPYNKDSGNQKKRRCIQGGRAKVRKILYMAAHTAARCNPVIKAYVQRLQDRGKPYKWAIVAAMRKLLIHLQSVLRKPSPVLDS